MNEATPPSPATPPSKVTVLFSGGRDSSLSACLLARNGYDVRLLTCNNGVSIGADMSAYRHAELAQAFPNRITRRDVVSTMGLFRRIALANIEADFERYRKNLIVLGSQLAMHTEAVVYSIHNDTTIVASGFAGYQAFYAEQMPAAIDALKRFLAEYGLTYATPVYEYQSEDQVKYGLLDFGVSTKSLEAVSIFSDTFTPPTPQQAVEYLRDKSLICHDYIAFKLGDAGRRRPQL